MSFLSSTSGMNDDKSGCSEDISKMGDLFFDAIKQGWGADDDDVSEQEDCEEDLGSEEDDEEDDGATSGLAAPTGPSAPGTGPSIRARGIRRRWYVGATNLPTRPTYQVAADANGGMRTIAIPFDVDWDDAASVDRAVKRQRQEEYRAREKFGLRMHRPSSRQRTYTPQNDAWIIAEYHAFAAATNNARISMPELTRRYNLQFTTMPRTDRSLSSHVDKIAAIKAVKSSYAKQ